MELRLSVCADVILQKTIARHKCDTGKDKVGHKHLIRMHSNLKKR